VPLASIVATLANASPPRGRPREENRDSVVRKFEQASNDRRYDSSLLGWSADE